MNELEQRGAEYDTAYNSPGEDGDMLYCVIKIQGSPDITYYELGYLTDLEIAEKEREMTSLTSLLTFHTKEEYERRMELDQAAHETAEHLEQ